MHISSTQIARACGVSETDPAQLLLVSSYVSMYMSMSSGNGFILKNCMTEGTALILSSTFQYNYDKTCTEFRCLDHVNICIWVLVACLDKLPALRPFSYHEYPVFQVSS